MLANDVSAGEEIPLFVTLIVKELVHSPPEEEARHHIPYKIIRATAFWWDEDPYPSFIEKDISAIGPFPPVWPGQVFALKAYRRYHPVYKEQLYTGIPVNTQISIAFGWARLEKHASSFNLIGHKVSLKTQETLAHLLTFALPISIIREIYHFWGDDAPHILTHSPYRLLEMRESRFATADRVALSARLSPEDPARVLNFMRHNFALLRRRNATCMSLDDFIKTAVESLAIPPQVVRQALAKGGDEIKIELVPDDHSHYHPLLFSRESYSAENKLADRLVYLYEGAVDRYGSLSFAHRRLSVSGSSLTDIEKKACTNVLNESVSLIDGTPGPSLKRVLLFLKEICAEEICYVAPDRRSALFLAREFGLPFVSLRQFLARTEELIPLVILTGFSAIDLKLAVDFSDHVERGTQLVLVGDRHTKTGLFRALKDANLFPCVELPTAYPSTDGPSRLWQAQRFALGLDYSGIKPSSDLIIEEYSANEVIYKRLVELVCEGGAHNFLKNSKKFVLNDIEILAPTHGAFGFSTLNRYFQKKLSPEGNATPGSGQVFYKGDRVRAFSGTETENLFDGLYGTIKKLSQAGKCATVTLDDGRSYDVSIFTLELAYVQKLQRSATGERSIGIIPLDPHQNLTGSDLYQALVGSTQAVIFLCTPGARTIFDNLTLPLSDPTDATFPGNNTLQLRF